MNHISAKRETKTPHKNNANPSILQRKMLSFGVVIIALFAAGVTYFLVGQRGHIPPLPRVRFESDEQVRSLDDLKERAREFVPTELEERLIRKLVEIHKKEVRKEPIASEEDRLRVDLDAFGAEARVFGSQNPGRYLLLGDYLAYEFHECLNTLLQILRERAKTGSVPGPLKEAILEVVRTGGGFYERAVRSGAILPDGRLLASWIAPEVLFRARWRHFGALRADQDFTDVEKRAYFDFLTAFAPPTSVDKRLEAINELAKLTDSFDGVVARAIVLHEAGRTREAQKLVKRTLKQGRGDSVLKNLENALEMHIR